MWLEAAALMWAVSGPSAKYLFNHGVTPFELVQLRLTIGVALLFLWLLARRPASLRIARRDIFYFAVLGITGLAMVQFTYLLTISKIKVAAAILHAIPGAVLIAVYLLLFARQTLTRMTMIAVFLCHCWLLLGCWRRTISISFR